MAAHEPWPGVELGEWDREHEPFPPVLLLAGHRYELVQHKALRVPAPAEFIERVIAVVRMGEFLPYLRFAWRPYGSGLSGGRFAYQGFTVKEESPEWLLSQGGALYRRA